MNKTDEEGERHGHPPRWRFCNGFWTRPHMFRHVNSALADRFRQIALHCRTTIVAHQQLDQRKALARNRLAAPPIAGNPLAEYHLEN